MFFKCYFFICSKSFSVLSECFIHNIATLLYLPQKIHLPPISHCLIIVHHLSTTHHPSPARPSPTNSIAHRPSPGNILYSSGGGSFCTLLQKQQQWRKKKTKKNFYPLYTRNYFQDGTYIYDLFLSDILMLN